MKNFEELLNGTAREFSLFDQISKFYRSSIFRRIDGAAERIEFDYAASQQPFRHTTFPGDLPDLSTLLDEDVR